MDDRKEGSPLCIPDNLEIMLMPVASHMKIKGRYFREF